jgi:hypothetical protein
MKRALCLDILDPQTALVLAVGWMVALAVAWA